MSMFSPRDLYDFALELVYKKMNIQKKNELQSNQRFKSDKLKHYFCNNY